MENKDRPFARFVDFCRSGYEEYCRFLLTFYGGEAGAMAVNPRTSPARDAPEKAP